MEDECFCFLARFEDSHQLSILRHSMNKIYKKALFFIQYNPKRVNESMNS